jgi:hypothetical protein
MVRRDPAGIRLLTRNGHDWTQRYPLIAAAVDDRVRSPIDGEAVARGETSCRHSRSGTVPADCTGDKLRPRRASSSDGFKKQIFGSE